MSHTASLLETPVLPLNMRATLAQVPTPVTVVAAHTDNGRAAMVVGSFVSVSLEPPLVGFFVTATSTSWPLIRPAAVVGITALSTAQVDICRKLSKKDPDRFHDAEWCDGPLAAPLLRNGVAHFECSVEAITAAGDHDFVLCRVLRAERGTESNPLVFQDRALSGIAAA